MKDLPQSHVKPLRTLSYMLTEAHAKQLHCTLTLDWHDVLSIIVSRCILDLAW